MRLIIAGGGTGGHLFPGMAVAEEFLARSPENRVLFAGSARGIEARAVPAAGYDLRLIDAAGIRGKGIMGKLRGAVMMLNGIRQSRSVLADFRPDAVLGVGGYASLPLLLAARGRGITCCIHEQNAVPGMTNKLLARLVDRIFITVEESARFFPAGKTLVTGNPLRRQILNGRMPGNKTTPLPDETRKSGEIFNVLIFGGSQGAHAINMAMVEALPLLATSGVKLSITHQTGEKDHEEVQAAYGAAGLPARVLPFIHDMAGEYGRADLIICRAGATTIAEVTAMGKACLFIPFPFAVDDHQRKNAEALVGRDAGFMLLERDLNGARLAEMVTRLAGNPDLARHTGERAFGMARLDAAAIIVNELTK